ncbi:MAG TPA: hypothetical protein VJ841_03580 [Candidatus Saccharimonadales bacterium]|nr:hypothetical protein [Candidatus Saccharimonadales bacterium]
MQITVISHEFDDRRKDLEHAESVINDPSKPFWSRRRAHRAKVDIMRQLQDKKLRGLRSQLIKAALANDDLGQWKIAAQIKEYLGEPIPVKPTNEI